MEIKKKRYLSISISVIVVIVTMVGLRCYSYSIYVLSYMFVYFYMKHRKGSIKKTELFVLGCTAIVLSVLRLLIECTDIDISSWYELYDVICVPLFRTFLGMGIVVFFFYILKNYLF